MRKISICGKGGSGKSVVVTLMANVLREKGYSVLVVDSDESNSGLYRMLGFDKAPQPLMGLVGGKRGAQQKMRSKFSSGEAEPKMEILEQDEFFTEGIPPQCFVEKDGIKLIAIGKIVQSLEGCACPMGVLSREFLGKLSLEEREIAIVDMEAGVEHFGRGIETSTDAVLIPVEPSFESLMLAERIKGFAVDIEIGDIWAILNKVTSEEVDIKLREELGKRDVPVVGSIYYDPQVFQACLEGKPLSEGSAKQDMKRIVGLLLK